MRIITLDSQNQEEAIAAAVECLQNDGLVIYPTETVYGIGANPHSKSAIDKLFQYKGRREGKPLSIAVANQEMATNYVAINEQAAHFYHSFLPGPYTVVSKSKNTVDPRVNSEFGTLGIRIPAYPLIQNIVSMFGQAMTSTSANISGGKRPYRIDELLQEMGPQKQQLIDLIIDVGELPKNEPSVVIDTTLSTPIALRGNLQNTATGGEVFQSATETDTMALAGRLLIGQLNHLARHGLIIALNGELGMGKTIFTKGVAQFFKIPNTISSPTYSYINEYTYTRGQQNGTLYHIDAWKIDGAQEAALLQIDQLIQPGNILVVEWWSQLAPFIQIPEGVQCITLDFTSQQELRIIHMHKRYAQDF